MSEELKSCPFCGHRIDIEKDVYDPSRDWSPTFIDPDSGGDPINIHCECGLEFCTGTYDWDEFVKAWNRRASEIDAQPTAYDADKVVRQLEAYSNADEAERLGTMPVVELTDAITIVKGGGINA